MEGGFWCRVFQKYWVVMHAWITCTWIGEVSNGKKLMGMHANWRPWFGESKGFCSGLNVKEKNELPPKAFKCLWMMLIARSIWNKVLPWRHHLGDFFSQNFHPWGHRLPLKTDTEVTFGFTVFDNFAGSIQLRGPWVAPSGHFSGIQNILHAQNQSCDDLLTVCRSNHRCVYCWTMKKFEYSSKSPRYSSAREIITQ